MSYTKLSIDKMQAKAEASFSETRRMMQRLKKQKPQQTDRLFHSLHHQEFAKIDCLECANCCKTISPAIYDADIRRMAKLLKMKDSDFIDQYLNPDTEEDYVFKQTPCPFLGSDNYCSIYEARPKACREYPHTDRKRMYQILNLTARNSKTCPAVFNITEAIRNQH